MPFINFSERKNLKIWEGITTRLFHSEQITFGHVILQPGAEVLEQSHVHEQWTHVIEGEIMFKINGEKKLLTPGMAAFMPSDVTHSAKAITLCKVIDCFLPVRVDFVELEKQQHTGLNKTDKL